MVTTTRESLLADADATLRAGRALAPALHGGMLVTLEGELGAGKTTLARGILRGLGHAGAVKSPSYAVVEHYRFSSLYLYHFDFYRFADPREWETAGFSEYFRDDAAWLVEWPERAAGFLPPADLSLVLSMRDDDAPGRRLVAHASTAAGERALDALATIPD
ncbi:MAG TPA: tRNA (adenosine(37)-N6)-threonylcarbamoyltransferase complex ATPase subunit type 1 TsaE [Casimicrobiaceae bacterium]|nr:tRNA (adenosine(37)-N6)-threonylcarbamoyltransferase complex ATPase subunit type 1 TsaE [Casimicrobiaceae bacterium]